MIDVEIFTHQNIIDGSIFFEEDDLEVLSIRNKEKLTKYDFDKLWAVIKEINTEYLKPGVRYKLTFKREPKHFRFELVRLDVIE